MGLLIYPIWPLIIPPCDRRTLREWLHKVMGLFSSPMWYFVISISKEVAVSKKCFIYTNSLELYHTICWGLVTFQLLCVHHQGHNVVNWRWSSQVELTLITYNMWSMRHILAFICVSQCHKVVNWRRDGLVEITFLTSRATNWWTVGDSVRCTSH